MINRRYLRDGLQHLGVVEGDIVMVHASLRAVGPVDGGAATVVAALDDAVGFGGTTLMTLGALDDWSWVNEHPAATRAELLADAEPFDALVTPADPDNGVLAEIFRTLPGTIVSNHPEGRFGARGANAIELVQNQPWNDYYGLGSPLARLVQRNGKVLRLGADLDTVTLLHYAEYLVDIPTKRRVQRHRRVREGDAAAIRAIECLDDSEGIVRWSGEDYFALILRAYLATGRARNRHRRAGRQRVNRRR